MSRKRLFLILLGSLAMSLYGQTTGSNTQTAAQKAQEAEKNKPLINSSHPQWLRDLRRGEIVAFGAFPFTFFLSNMIMDSFRMSQHNWDTRYAPWPLKSAGAVNMTSDEFAITVGAAAAGAVLAAIADHVILRIKRYRDAKAAARLPPGQPIIIRKPWPESEESLDAASIQEDASTSADETSTLEDAAHSAEPSPIEEALTPGNGAATPAPGSD